jgi:hypothetical protein
LAGALVAAGDVNTHVAQPDGAVMAWGLDTSGRVRMEMPGAMRAERFTFSSSTVYVLVTRPGRGGFVVYRPV